MKKLLRIAAVVCALCWGREVSAQYYTWGSDPAGLKWNTIRTPDVRMIYPDTVSGLARRTLFYINTVRPFISTGFSRGPMRIPFVMHPENFRSNGLVMYLPKRVEFLTSPSIDGYSMPWGKQLVAHEYRHAVQYNNLNVGIPRILSYILGQQGYTIGLLGLPIWAMEGDATMCETQMSSFGRGLQPSFTIEYRALGRDVLKRKNIDKWFCGSYREYIPDHYRVGYQICSYAYDRFGENIWNKVVRYSSRNLYMIVPTTVALSKYYDTGSGALFRETFDDLNRYWEALPAQQNSSEPLTALPDRNYTSYQWPQSLGDSLVLAVKGDLNKPSRLVTLDKEGREELFCHTGQLSTRPAVGGGRVWWTEYRRSKLFEQRVNSQLCYADLSDGKPRMWIGKRNALYPTPADGKNLAWVEYNPDGQYVVVFAREGVETRYPIPEYKEIHGLAWDELTVALYVLVTDDDGMWLARVDQGGLFPLTEGAYITLSDLRAGDGKLYFGSIASGRDEVHCYDLMGRREYRISTSEYGSFDPAPASGGVLMTTYERRGYYLARQQVDSLRNPVAPSHLPLNVVNPPRRKWDVVNLDTVRFTAADSVASSRDFREKRYRKVPNLINVHSWMPLAFNPFEVVDEHVVDLNIGVTLLSQNLLSNTEAFASYGWNHSEGSLWKLGVRYFGLGVHFDLDASYGGNQVIYSVGQFNAQTGKPEYQREPAPNKYYSVGLSSTLPLYFQRGYHTRQLSLSVAWNYSNGMVADLGKIFWDAEAHKITNIEHIGYKEGLHKLSFGASFSDAVRAAPRDLVTPWGYLVSANYTLNPANSHFSDLVSFYGRVYTPGFFAHHSVMVAANYQTSIGGYRLPSGITPLGYKSTRLLPNGIKSSEIRSNNYTAFALDYQLPVWYPEGGIGSVLYFKRIRLNLGGCYAQFREPGPAGMQWHRLWSYGGDLVFDINVFRQPASATSTFKLSVYHPSTGGVWVGGSVGLPF